MDFILQRTRYLVNRMAFGAFLFMFLGYIAKAIPVVSIGIALLAIAINFFGIYLFFCYPDLREEVTLGLVVELVAGGLLWM